jgi:hypothetical protein
MRRLLLVAALVGAANIGTAQATTIDFEDVAVPVGTQVNQTDVTAGGFLFDTLADHSHLDNGTWAPGNGTTYLVIDDVFGLDPTTFSPLGGAPFALTSIDISEASSADTYAHQIEVTGNRFGGGTTGPVILTLDFDGVTHPTFAFQTFAFGAGWDNLSSVVLKGIGASCCGAVPGNYYAIDNVVVAAVPEPGTLALLGLGSAYILGRRRRVRR